MFLAELLPLAGALSAPAFFLLFALASLGSPLLALLCLTVGQLRSTQYIEAYARRLLRMALSASLPALLAFGVAAGVAAYNTPWLKDWVLASPLGPGLFAVAGLAFFASLLTLRLSRPSSRHARQNNPLGQAFILAALALAVIWLALALTAGLLEQAQEVLRAPRDGSLAVAHLITPDASTLPPLFWTALAALAPLCTACSAALSMEYLIALRDREPFGREALGQMLRIAARGAMRSGLLATAFLPVLWMHLRELPTLPGGLLAARIMLGLAGACALALCLCAGVVSRSNRPWTHSLAVHLGLAAIWLGLTALLCVALLHFYGV